MYEVRLKDYGIYLIMKRFPCTHNPYLLFLLGFPSSPEKETLGKVVNSVGFHTVGTSGRSSPEEALPPPWIPFSDFCFFTWRGVIHDPSLIFTCAFRIFLTTNIFDLTSCTTFHSCLWATRKLNWIELIYVQTLNTTDVYFIAIWNLLAFISLQLVESNNLSTYDSIKQILSFKSFLVYWQRKMFCVKKERRIVQLNAILFIQFHF